MNTVQRKQRLGAALEYSCIVGTACEDTLKPALKYQELPG